jgi:hypothetical protein
MMVTGSTTMVATVIVMTVVVTTMIALAVMVVVATATIAGTSFSLGQCQHGSQTSEDQNLGKPGKPVKEALFWSRIRFHRMVSCHPI